MTLRFNRYRARRRRLALVRSANSDSPGRPRLLVRTNTLAVGRNAHGFPSKVALHGFLEEDPSLMRIVCRVFFQDFACFGYALPAACRSSAHFPQCA